jgi:hypothetical protein
MEEKGLTHLKPIHNFQLILMSCIQGFLFQIFEVGGLGIIHKWTCQIWL